MTAEWRKRVRTLFDQASDLPPPERSAFLDTACRGEPELRAAVESLLAHDAGYSPDHTDDTFLRSPLVRLLDEDPLHDPALAEPGLPVAIGHYRILRLLGEGGMGTVYQAEQDNPRRTVALKVIRSGLVSVELLKRFTQEAQILGRLQHPSIAQIHEAGMAADGRPYFAMEFIQGRPLDQFARSHSLDPAARLDLVARVADAVQHAHDKGVIHRDLKPSNILVDEAGQPKVLDFGVARATDADLQTTTGRTEIGQLIGTLDYMSPEQIAADPALIDERSDVYALGVILFVLLAERLPHDLAGLPLPEVARVIRDQEPSSLGALNARWRGDVETIVGKALAKDRARRYPSARELAADIRRWLHHEPIRARPPSFVYRVQKFVRRHTALVGGVAGIMAALVLGLIGTTLFALRAADLQGQAEQNARLANEEKQEAVYQTYRARLAAANAALQNHDVAAAARHLDAAPPEHRDWEWWHLHSRLDDRSGRITAPPGQRLWLLPGHNEILVGRSTPAGLILSDIDGRHARTVPFPVDWGMITVIQPSSKGLRLMATLPPNVLTVWDEDRNVIVRGPPPQGLIRLSPDGTLLAVTQVHEKRVGFGLYETASGQRQALCAAHVNDVLDLTFSPDGERLASAGDDRLVHVWKAATGALIATCRGHTSKVISVAFRPDGARLVTTSADGTVRQWDPATGKEVEPAYDHHKGDVLSAVYSPDGEWIASGGSDRTIRLWQAAGQQEAAVLHGHTGAVYRLAFTSDGRRLVSLSQKGGFGWAGDDSVGVWEVAIPSGLPVLRGHTDYVYPVAYSPNGRWIASGSWDRTVRVWDSRTGEPCGVLDNGAIVKTLAFSPDSAQIVTAQPGWLQIWDVATRRCLHRFKIPATNRNIHAVAWHPNGMQVGALDNAGRCTIQNATTGEVVATLSLGVGHDTKALAYSPDGRWLVGTRADLKTLCIFDTKSYQLATQWPGHKDTIRALAFSADSRHLASCGVDRTVRVWEVQKGTCQELIGHTDEVFAVAFHPDGTRLASAGRDGTVWLWNRQRGEEVARLHGHAGYIWALEFSPDGKTLVSGGGDKTVRLWDTAPLAQRYAARREQAPSKR